ncbi:MAG: peptidoglycan-binding protein [Gallintestinimicrobium sp.]
MPQLSCAAAEETGYPGSLMICVTSSVGFFPVVGATVTISDSDSPEQILETLTTDESGQTTSVLLPAPNPAYSQSPSNPRPYTDYIIEVQADGYEPVRINGAEILPDESSILPVSMTPTAVSDTPEEQDIFIPDHTLYGEYRQIPEAEIKTEAETGEIVLSRVVIPEYHRPTVFRRFQRTNLLCRYQDYIKNVASSKSAWRSTIYANILVIQSFTLNRVYTEWYRAKGYSFTITSSTAYDQKFIYGRNIYSNIDPSWTPFCKLSLPPRRAAADLYQLLRRKPRQLSGPQWGSKYLGDQGYSAIEIIRYYYGNDMYINAAQAISGVPSSRPGYDLTIGASGTKVRQMQEQLNRISQNYPAIPKTSADGIFGSQTAAQVRAFQRIFNLPATGIVDYPTWYQISNIYVAVSRIAEPGT